MNILITGGSGFLAGRLAMFLSGIKNFNIVLSTRREKYQFFKNKKIKIFNVNWDSDCSVKNMCMDIDVIFHLSSPNAQECEKNPEIAFKVNVDNTKKLVKAAFTNKIKRIIYFSTAHVYSSSLIGNIVEGNKTTNKHPYAKSHLMAEKCILNFNQKKNHDGIIFRLSNSYGYPINFDINCWKLFVNNLCKSGIENRKLIINSSKNVTRNFFSIDELCRISNYFIDLKMPIHENNIYNIGGEKSYTLMEFAKQIQTEFKKTLSFNPEIVFKKSFDKKSSISFIYNIKKLKSTGYVFDYSNNNEIKNLIEYCVKNFTLLK